LTDDVIFKRIETAVKSSRFVNVNKYTSLQGQFVFHNTVQLIFAIYLDLKKSGVFECPF
jgi:hypothetical protein